MVDRFEIYFRQGFYFLKSGITIALITYAVILAILWIIGKKGLKNVKPFSFKKMIIEYLLVLYIVAILKITGVIGMTFNISWFIEAIKYFDFSIPFVGSSILMVTLNFMLFIPLGFLIPVVLKNKKWNWKILLLIGFSLSFSIEFLQLFGGRSFEIDDMLTNTFGTVVGYLLFETVYGIIEEKMRKKSLIKGISIILGTIIIIFSLSIISNGDAKVEKNYDLYTEMGSEVEINDISKVSVNTYEDKKEISDTSIYMDIYNSFGIDISNGASYYAQNDYNANINSLIKNTDGKYLEILFKGKHSFTFYNNHYLELNEVQHILYNLNDGTVYLGIDDSENYIYILKYENGEYPFKINEVIYERIKDL